jgi:hypothetical protein
LKEIIRKFKSEGNLEEISEDRRKCEGNCLIPKKSQEYCNFQGNALQNMLKILSARCKI